MRERLTRQISGLAYRYRLKAKVRDEAQVIAHRIMDTFGENGNEGGEYLIRVTPTRIYYVYVANNRHNDTFTIVANWTRTRKVCWPAKTSLREQNLEWFTSKPEPGTKIPFALA